ncbi:MAG: hydrolase [Eggerthellaceae bacterium]|nr:hydrolase [Eggerthellaceae bacterium]
MMQPGNTKTLGTGPKQSFRPVPKKPAGTGLPFGRTAPQCLKKITPLFLAALLLVGLFPPLASAVSPNQPSSLGLIPEIHISDLSTAGASYNNKKIQLVGEAVGDLIYADLARENCWVLLSSLDPQSNDSISIFMSRDEAAKIDTFGRYQSQGTTLRIVGVFHLVCPDHDGLSDIHAEEVIVLVPGITTTEPFSWQTFIPGGITVLVGLAFLSAYYWARERRR